MKKNNKKGFTLAELLIVVAIIAILVAIAIPVFSAQLNKAKIATDKANIRSWYAEEVATYLSDPDAYSQPGDIDFDLKSDGAVTITGTMGDEDSPFTVTFTVDGANEMILPDGATAPAGS